MAGGYDHVAYLPGTYYTFSKTRWTGNVFPLTLALTLKHNNVFGLKNDVIF